MVHITIDMESRRLREKGTRTFHACNPCTSIFIYISVRVSRINAPSRCYFRTVCKFNARHRCFSASPSSIHWYHFLLLARIMVGFSLFSKLYFDLLTVTSFEFKSSAYTERSWKKRGAPSRIQSAYSTPTLSYERGPRPCQRSRAFNLSHLHGDCFWI